MFYCFLHKYKESSFHSNELSFSDFWFLNERSYLNFAERGARASQSRPAPLACGWRESARVQQAVRSLGLLRCACYQVSTCSLSTRSSAWDLDLIKRWDYSSWAASRLDAFSAYPFST